MDRHTGIYTIVLTGGIASGKTAVSASFERMGAAIIDTDLIARQIVEPGQPALAQVAEEFGADFLDHEGRLNRPKMRDAIFSDPAQKLRLEGILHPLIAGEVLRQIRQLDAPYCILVVPLFTGTATYSWTDRVLVVDVSEEVQIKRVEARDGISLQQAQAILDSQISRQARLALADDVLDNSGSLAELNDKVKILHKKYLELAEL